MAHAISIPETGSPTVLTPVDLPKPQPGPGEVLVRNRAGAVNFIDTIIRSGQMPEGTMPKLPLVPGVEGAGVVEAIGEGVRHVQVGDPVAWMGPVGVGGYGSHSVIGAPYVAKLATDLDLATAAALPVNAMTAWHMLVNLGRARAGDTVLVHGAAGGVGTMLLQLARHLGLTAIGSASTDKLQYSRAQGADYVIDYRTEDVSARVLEITDGRGVDLSLNPIAGDTLTGDLEALAPLGTAVLFGFLAGPPRGTFSDDLAKHFQKSIAVRVSDIYTYFHARPQDFSADLSRIFGLLADGTLRPQVAVLPLAEAAEAHRRLEAGETTGKVVLAID